MTDDNIKPMADREALEAMVAEVDTGARKPVGSAKHVIFFVALGWALFQLWYASPLPYILNFGVINDGQARIIHLSFAFLLAFTTFPAFKTSRRDSIPLYDWVLAALAIASAVAAGSYLASSMAPLVSWLDPVKYLSLFYWAVGDQQLEQGVSPLSFVVLLVVCLALAAVAMRAFEHHDLH